MDIEMEKVAIVEEDRQMILLSLALCTLLRPGFYYACGEIADQFKGREMFEDFRRLNADQVHSPRPNEDAELLDWLYVAAGRTPRPPAGDFVRSIADVGLRADHENYELLRPVLLQLKAKYPRHTRSAEEIRKELEGG